MSGELRDYYLRALPGRIEALESSLRAADTDDDARANVRRIAHSLKGSGASYGFPRISEAASAAEDASDADLAGRVAALLAVMRETIEQGAAPAAAAPERILVVDDDPDVMHLIRTVVEQPGRTVVPAADVASAMKALDSEDPALIILDLVLPDGDGRSLLMRLRERPATATTPIIVLTATSSERARAECIALGADQALSKPFDPALLGTTVRTQLERAARVRQVTHHDVLTGLPNRAAFSETWREVAEHAEGALRIAMLDLDHFDRVNHAFGHQQGDAVLRQFAGVAREELKHARMLARWGGEDFAALYEGAGAAHAEVELAGLVERTRKHAWQIEGGASAQVSLSVGLADAGERPPLDEAVARASYYLYLAKATGRGRVVSSESPVEAPGRRILLAEDDDLTASLVLHRLRREGFEVDHYTAGQEALDGARSQRYALAILDVKMPGMDGFQLLRELRAMNVFAEIPILMLTSMGSEEDVVRGFELGATDYVLKPFSPVELVARVQRHLRRA